MTTQLKYCSTYSDAFIAELSSILDACEAELKRFNVEDVEVVRTAESVRLGSNLLGVRLDYHERSTYKLEIVYNAASFNIWNRTQPLAEALEYARFNLKTASLGVQWEAEHGHRVWHESDMHDADKCAARDERVARESAIEDACAQVSTDRRRGVLNRAVDNGLSSLNAKDRAVLRSMPLIFADGSLTPEALIAACRC